jgi:phospholipase C
VVTGDLLAAFGDWSSFDPSWPASFPSTAGNTNASKQQCDGNPPPVIPTAQAMPVQEVGTRAQRPLPYEFAVHDTAVPGANGTLDLAVAIKNAGAAGACFFVYDRMPSRAAAATPRKYTVEGTDTTPPGSGGGDLLDLWHVPANASGVAEYWFALHGPNGFVRTFRGTSASHAAGRGFSAGIAYDQRHQAVVLTAASASAAAFTVHDNAYGAGRLATLGGVGAARSHSHRHDTAATGNWCVYHCGCRAVESVLPLYH